MSDQAYCGFCFATARQGEMFRLVICPPGEEGYERSQMMFCHGACLDRALHPEMWRHPDLLEDEALDPSANEIESNEKLAEAAYDAMYEVKPYAAKDSFDDARKHFINAIEIAKCAGLDDEVSRLTARLDHIVSVYNSQFRGIR